MKKIKLQQLITGIVVCGTLIMSSCSREDEDINAVDENINLTVSISEKQTDAQRIANTISLGIDEFNNPKFENFLNEDLDQKAIDAYIKRFGLEGLVNSDPREINKIIKEIAEAFEISAEDYINNSSYSDYTKRTLIIQSSGIVIEDLEKQREFSLIPVEEQKLLLSNNDLIIEFLKINNNTRCSLECGVGAFTGFIVGGVIGNAVCGPPCGIAGGIVGGIIGGIIGSGKQ